MAVWNTLVEIVALVEADTEEEAISKLIGRVREVRTQDDQDPGFMVYDELSTQSAFLSERGVDAAIS